VCTVSSDGFINLYDIASVPTSNEAPPQKPTQIKPLTSYDSKGTRLTCVTLADADAELSTIPQNGKRKRPEDVHNDAESEVDNDSGNDEFDEEWEGVGRSQAAEDEAEDEDEGENEDEGEELDEEQ